MKNLIISKNLNKTNIRPKDVLPVVKEALGKGYDIGHDSDFQNLFQHLIDQFLVRSDAYSKQTIRRLTTSWHKFESWCLENNRISLPATEATVEDFFTFIGTKHHYNTLKVYKWSISKIHNIVGCPDPCEDIYVKSTIRGVIKKKILNGEKSSQATPFRLVHLEEVTKLWQGTENLKKLRDLAIFHIAYESLLREQELANIQLTDIELMPDASAVLTVYVTKTNTTGEPESIILSKHALKHINIYIQSLGLSFGHDGYLFRAHKKGDTIDNCIQGQCSNVKVSNKLIERAFKSVWSELSPESRGSKPFSGHSARVGAAQDLADNDYSLLRIQLAGRWKDPKMPALYCRKILATQSAMAKFRQ